MYSHGEAHLASLYFRGTAGDGRDISRSYRPKTFAWNKGQIPHRIRVSWQQSQAAEPVLPI